MPVSEISWLCCYSTRQLVQLARPSNQNGTFVQNTEIPAGVLVGEIDCKGSGKEICVSLGVKTFPNIKFGDPNNLQLFTRGKALQELKSLLLNVPHVCTPANLGSCSFEEKAIIQTLQAMPFDDLEALLGSCTFEATMSGIRQRDNTATFAMFLGDISPPTEAECARRCCEQAECTAWVLTKKRCELYGALKRKDMPLITDYMEGSPRSARRHDPTRALFEGNKKRRLAFGYLRAVHSLRKAEAKAASDEL